jgi:hypothetical protein
MILRRDQMLPGRDLLRPLAAMVTIISMSFPYEGKFVELSPVCNSKACDSARESGWKQG